jgi:hypothetical protein
MSEEHSVRFEPVPHAAVAERPAWGAPNAMSIGLEAAQAAIVLLETRAASAEARLEAVEKSLSAAVAFVAPLTTKKDGALMSATQTISLTQIEELLAAIAAAFKSFNLPVAPAKPAA